MSDVVVRRPERGRINARWLSAIDRLLKAGIQFGPKVKSNAVNKVLELVPEWTRGDCWRRLRQLRRMAELAGLNKPAGGGSPTRRSSPRRTAYPRWTAAQEDRLLNWTGYEPVKTIAQRLGRSESAIRSRMSALGLSAKVTDGWTLRAVRDLLRVSPARVRFLIGSGRLRVRDPRITAASLAEFFEDHRARLKPGASERFAAAREEGNEGYSWDSAASILGTGVEQIQQLIGSGRLKVVDPFVTDRQFEEFCKKHGGEFNLSLLDRPTAQWLVTEYGLPAPMPAETPAPSHAQKHALMVRACKCGKRIAGNAYFRHIRACPTLMPTPVQRQSNEYSETQLRAAS